MELLPLTLLCWHCALVNGDDVVDGTLAMIAKFIPELDQLSLGFTIEKFREYTDWIGLTDKEIEDQTGMIKEWKEDVKSSEFKNEVQKLVKDICNEHKWEWHHVSERIDIDETADYDRGEDVVDTYIKNMAHGSARTCYVYSGEHYKLTHFKSEAKTGGTLEVISAHPKAIVYKFIPYPAYLMQARIIIKGKCVTNEGDCLKNRPRGHCFMDGH